MKVIFFELIKYCTLPYLIVRIGEGRGGRGGGQSISNFGKLLNFNMLVYEFNREAK